ncbi:hypothetical protein CEUSTIGMA_g9451.t1 [Chlamydomonas eustigma]|uniref:ER membrane protein complex subunit 4 n=1 Tax=Chlamydomonas eustigma TaxID=1157962 RepID=A0A250XG50_9CHLO|nr:hypothetical protein CEUSTIGMA_g9451.t1 [Chlamydomonas eustigma]|eukprot:GAX82023.1 hypothetical protein CEUSTIGMA_g9451.t1 [Chlamydomonas eustigma]
MTGLSWSMGFDSITPGNVKSLDPPGFDVNLSKDLSIVPTTDKKKDVGMLQRKQQALYARATSHVKNVGFMCFMAWMSGNGIQIFSILMTFNLLSAPISAILGSGKMFPKEEDWPQLDVLMPRLLFCAIQLGQLLFGLYKLDGMGLLPVYPSDWISTMAVPASLERSFSSLS